MSTADSTVLHVERSFEAQAEDVFDAWTSPEVLRRWWLVDQSWRTAVAEVDLRVGGAYRLSMEDPEAGTFHTVVGEYREVQRPERLVYSWSWEEADGQIGHESTVTVRFVQQDERTTVLLEHSDLPAAESRERHGYGWNGCLDSLGIRIFAEVSQPS